MIVVSLVRVCKMFTFDAAHQLIGHAEKCANLHGHTYTLEVVIMGVPSGSGHPSDEGFVMDFAKLKKIVKDRIVNALDHAFIAQGTEPVLETLQATGSKVAILGFRTTVENMAQYICHELLQTGLPVFSVKLWETPTAWAEVYAKDVASGEPVYKVTGACDFE